MASRVTARAVQVATAAPTLLAPNNPNRRILEVANLGPNAIFVGPSDVTTATGYPVSKVDANGVAGTLPPLYYSVGDQSVTEALYAIAATALQTTPADTRVLEAFSL